MFKTQEVFQLYPGIEHEWCDIMKWKCDWMRHNNNKFVEFRLSLDIGRSVKGRAFKPSLPFLSNTTAGLFNVQGMLHFLNTVHHYGLR